MKPFVLVFSALLAITGVIGCANQSTLSADEQKQARDAFASNEFDINKVPPEHREKVKAFMQQSPPPSQKTGEEPGR